MLICTKSQDLFTIIMFIHAAILLFLCIFICIMNTVGSQVNSPLAFMNEDDAVSLLLAIDRWLAEAHAHSSWNDQQGEPLVRQWRKRDHHVNFQLFD